MSRENNLPEFLTGIADALRGLKKTNEKIEAQNFQSEIRALESLLDKPDQTKTVIPNTTEQVVTPDTGFELGSVTVVAVNPSDYYKAEETTTVTPTKSSQTITPNSGKVFSSVVVNPIPSNYIDPAGTKTITENGVHTVTEYDNVSVNINKGAGTTVTADKVLTGHTFYDSTGVLKTGTLAAYEVSSTLENLTMTGKSFAFNNEDYVATLKTAQYHESPETIEVKINGIVLTQGVDYTYTPHHDGYTVTVKCHQAYYSGQKQYYSTDEGVTWIEIPCTYAAANTEEITVLTNIKQIMFKTEHDPEIASLRLMSSETLGFSWVSETTNYILTCDVPDVYIWSD